MGDSGDDRLIGNDGNAGADRITGSTGTDTVSYATHSVRVVADPDGVAGDDGTPGTDFTPPEGDTIDGDVENLTGTPFPDTPTGNSLDNFIAGGNGVDTIDGGLGDDDSLDGVGAGNTLDGGTHLTGDVCKNGPTFINCNP